MAERFKIDETGAVVGPGLHIKAEHQLMPGHIVFTVKQLNDFYELGVLEGKLAESTVKR